ncbi:MAG TPA: gliding motility-associated protein GldE [Chitinophagaceae bacterium]|nr:gliding motility-associated protein GldE [Chitinophagaceae bacterium]
MDIYSVIKILHKESTSTFIAIINTQTVTTMVVFLILLLGASFCLTGAKVAFCSLSNKDINMLKTKTHASAKRILFLLENPKILFATILISSSVINISIILLSSFLVDAALPNLNNLSWLVILLKLVSITLLLILLGGIIPMLLAKQRSLMFVYNPVVLTVIEFFNYLFRRAGSLWVQYSGIFEKKFARRDTTFSFEQIDQAIDLTVDENTTIEEKNILKGIVKFGNIPVKQIMKARLDVSGIEFKLNFFQVKGKVEELHYSRLPVYKETLDEIKGILHTKDLIPYLHEGGNFNWHTLIREPYFVHEHKLIDDLLRKFQQKRVHFAIVVDEFGGTSGIVTLEDIMEEIIGDIKDEFDEEESGNKKIDNYNFVFEGKTMIHDVCKMMDLPLDTFDKIRGSSNSLAGLILELAGEFPKRNEIIKSGDFDFTVLDIHKNKIQRVKITVIPAPFD